MWCLAGREERGHGLMAFPMQISSGMRRAAVRWEGAEMYLHFSFIHGVVLVSTVGELNIYFAVTLQGEPTVFARLCYKRRTCHDPELAQQKGVSADEVNVPASLLRTSWTEGMARPAPRVLSIAAATEASPLPVHTIC
jgi:hypothetical protein